ncbi:MAG: hypothetical protein NWE93_03450 [Candidatus Bathyarchaeota archaeon]|nr:hypothetical protein [Candidatus Bathyarchaeota archaeon]
MAHITIEYMIMVPLLILQIFLFPLVATAVMDNYTDSRRSMQLQETASHLASTIQQLYYTINHASMNGSLTINVDLPYTIEQYSYGVTLTHSAAFSGGYKVMNVTLSFHSAGGSASTLVTLGNNVDWQPIAFNSTQTNLCLTASKTADSIELSIGGS